MEISVERVPHNGHLVLRTTYRNNHYRHTYIGHSVREAKQLFREYVKGEDAKIFRNKECSSP
jgi:hypothetical protein